MSVSLFADGDDVQRILEALINDGLVVIHGGRVGVRRKMAALQSLIDAEELTHFSARSTLNHPDTELGVAYDVQRFSFNSACRRVRNAYDDHVRATDRSDRLND